MRRLQVVFPSASYYPMASINAQRGLPYLLARLPRRDRAPGLQQARMALRLDAPPLNRRAAAKQLQTLERQLEASSYTPTWRRS